MSLRLRCILLVVAAALPAACRSPATGTCTSGDQRPSARLAVGTDLTDPPFAFRKPEGGPSGFDVEFAGALTKEMKANLLLVNRGTSSLVPELLAHRLDLAVSALRDTPDLRTSVCVSKPYLGADLGLLVPRPDPSGIKQIRDLESRTVGILRGSASETWVRGRLRSGAVRTLETLQDLLDGLRSRRLDAALIDAPIARFAQSHSPEYTMVATVPTGVSYVVAASPDEGALIARVNTAIDALVAKGTLAQLETKWFGS